MFTFTIWTRNITTAYRRDKNNRFPEIAVRDYTIAPAQRKIVAGVQFLASGARLSKCFSFSDRHFSVINRRKHV
jgi:hypothetical protein